LGEKETSKFKSRMESLKEISSMRRWAKKLHEFKSVMGSLKEISRLDRWVAKEIQNGKVGQKET